jgi:hypothetical protein
MSYDVCGAEHGKRAMRCGLPEGHKGAHEDYWGKKFVADERVDRRHGERRKDQRFCEMDPRSYKDRRAPEKSTGAKAAQINEAPGAGAPADAVARITVKDGVMEGVEKIGPTPPDGEYLLIPVQPTVQDEERERLARWFWESEDWSDGNTSVWDDVDEGWRNLCREKADEAISILRAPSGANEMNRGTE